jgi:TolB-like protein/DNA-binding winged helix-turn-helix (wHTH) protein/Tfp pilus assembly protein PilF
MLVVAPGRHPSMSQARTIRFDGWVLRMELGELLKDGRRIRLQDQPLQLLDELLAHPGELVTREQLIARLWPKGVVDFDTGLNSVVFKLRIALQDEAETPHYIETVPRKGYRFIGTIEVPPAEPPQAPPPAHVQPGSLPELPAPDPVQAPADVLGPRSPAAYRRAYIYVAAVAAALVIATVAGFVFRRDAPALAGYEGQIRHVALNAKTLAVLPLRTSARDEVSVLIAQSVTDLIRNRLAALKDLTVVASNSTSGLINPGLDLRSVGEKLDARFLLKGGTDRSGERLHVDVELVDAQSGAQLWSKTFDRPVAEAAAIWDEIFRHVADVLRIPGEPAAGSAPANAGVNLDAYQLYMRGRSLLTTTNASDAEKAIELFQRATILDPSFARAYLGLGQALLHEKDLRSARTPEAQARAAKAFDRALELNSALGEAWIELARLTREPVKAEELYRKGLQLAPNYGAGYVHYADFLFHNSRAGEAIDTIRRGRQIDPLTPELHLFHAGFLMIARSDIAGHDRLVREALEIDPKLQRALLQLAYSRWEFSGEFAEAAQLTERALAVDPQFLYSGMMARDVYLDLGDAVAAAAVLGKSPSPTATMELVQYEGNRQGAAALLKDVKVEDWPDGGVQASNAEAIRDGAVANGDLGSAVRLLERIQATWAEQPRMHRRGFALVYAHTLVLAGEGERGRRLAESTLALMDTHSVGRAENFFCRERASAFAILREDERTLEELAICVKKQKLYRWWYLAERDPLYAHLRGDPRFQAVDEQARKHLDRQRALLEEMRRKGEIPARTASG